MTVWITYFFSLCKNISAFQRTSWSLEWLHNTMEECIELSVRAAEAVTQGRFVGGKVWGFSDSRLFSDLFWQIWDHLIIITEVFVKQNSKSSVFVADSRLWIKVTKKPSVKWKQVLIQVWASRVHLSTRAHTPCANVAEFFWPQRKLPWRHWGRREHPQPALNLGKCLRAWCSKASHLCTAPASHRTSSVGDLPSHDSVHAQRGCKKFSLILHPTWLPYWCESPNKPLHDIQLNLFLCIQYLAAHPVLLVLASTPQHIINHGKKSFVA